MNTGGLAQMSTTNFSTSNGLGNAAGGLSSRRGGQSIKPLSFETINNPTGVDKENTVPTPRTSRSHLLAGLRTAPKSATATSFSQNSATGPSQQYARSSLAATHGMGHDNNYSGPKTAFPQYAGQQQTRQHTQQAQQLQQVQQQPQQNGQQNGYQLGLPQYTVDQVLAPPELPVDEQVHDQMDPNMYANLVATNMYLAQQQQRLQQQLRSVQAAAQQFQQLNLNNPQLVQQQMAIYEQQQLLRNMQQQVGVQAALSQTQAHGQQVYYNPMTGQYYVDTAAAAQVSSPYTEQPMTPGGFNNFQQQQHQQQHMQFQSNSQQPTPRVQVSPPPENHAPSYRPNSPPKRFESPADVTPLPPPSANAFRRGHKKSSSLTPVNGALSINPSETVPMSAGPKTASFPMTPMTGGYGPGQARAGEHPIRQPRGPPSLDELKLKPTAKHDGSKNFATRTRRSAVHNLVRAGLERRKGTGSSAGSMSPVSETAEESTTPITDNDSESGRSGSGSLVGEMEHTGAAKKFASVSWGAIGSDRPSSRQNARKGSDSEASGGEGETSSFANVFKNGALRASQAQEATADQRKAPRLVLTSVEKRRASATPVA